jgi:hypothetical protein
VVRALELIASGGWKCRCDFLRGLRFVGAQTDDFYSLALQGLQHYFKFDEPASRHHIPHLVNAYLNRLLGRKPEISMPLAD